MERIDIPQVFKNRNESEFVLIKKEELENLIECSRSIEKAITIVEKVAIGVGLIVLGIIIGMMLL
ncbi:hypothetical protein [Lachnoanaerobaculum umeaense]|uniref:Uncharacterized protein n=1 Tax=Lachnoanaerobaculum umeaense TaxID=617123 RepID=A0A385Q3H6_9FIRM|nr:hypothetical protein [Lachnoanaerobaculum umeaense]AYB00240.1 hypothetical protein D4A81_10000 [Lachnoanaerobaculum umeaense]PZW96721.1 hypothetical protein C7439_11148 [Lachnoanaerobaculum umeaense]